MIGEVRQLQAVTRISYPRVVDDRCGNESAERKVPQDGCSVSDRCRAEKPRRPSKDGFSRSKLRDMLFKTKVIFNLTCGHNLFCLSGCACLVIVFLIVEFELFEFEFADASKSKTVPCYKVSWCDVVQSKRGGYKIDTKTRLYQHRYQNGTVQARMLFEFVGATFEFEFAHKVCLQERKEKYNVPIKRDGKTAYTWVYNLPTGLCMFFFSLCVCI